MVDGAGNKTTAYGTTFAAATAFTSLGAFTTEIDAIVTNRAEFGADMAVLQSAANTLSTESVNLSASYSRVMDTDYAAESTAASKNQILQQAGIASLAQSNQNPAMVLSLLR